MFRGWLRRFISSPRQTPILVGRGTKARRNTVLGLEQLEERSLLSIGGLDLTFGTNGVATTNTGDTVNVVGTVVQSGKIIVAGTDTTTGSIVMARYNSNGTIDTTFGTNGDGVVTTKLSASGDNLHTAAIALQTDGKIIITGTDFGDTRNTFVARFNAADGSLDTTFNSQETPGFNDFNIGILESSSNFGADHPDALFVNPADNSILIAGDTTVFGQQEFAIARVTSAGVLDNTFDGNGVTTFGAFSGGSSAFATGIALQSTGKIIVSGTASILVSGGGNGSMNEFAVIRLGTNGALDSLFGAGGQELIPFSNANATANALAIQSDDSIVLGGFASILTGPSAETTLAALARLTSNGSPDGTFGTNGIVTTTSGTFSSINALALQSDGSIIGAGSFNSKFGVARYTTTGVLDVTFGTNGIAQPSLGPANDTGAAVGVAIQPNDGRIVVTGNDAAFSGQFVTVRLLSSLLSPSISLSASPNPGILFENVTLTATITGNPAVPVPTGSLTFLDGSTVLGSVPIVNGVASLTTNALSAGVHSLTVSYAANIDYAFTVSPAVAYTVVDPLALFVADLYRTVLLRQADPSGVTFWVAQIRGGLATRGDAALSFEESPERRGLDVDLTYQVIFHRNPDPSGFAYWVGQLVSGALNEGNFTAAVFNSPEYLATHTDLNGFINSVFEVALGRAATASDLAFFSNLVQSGQATRATVVLLILGTPEAYQLAVTQDYLEFLNRSADASGLAFFLGKINGGFTPKQLAADILASDEFFADAQMPLVG